MARREALKITETAVKSQIKDYLAIKGIFSFPLTQGLGSYRGAPDRIIHYNGKVIYLEVKIPTGKMSDWQLAFQKQSELDSIDYHIIRSLEDLQAIIEPPPSTPSKSVSRRLKAQSSNNLPKQKKKEVK